MLIENLPHYYQELLKRWKDNVDSLLSKYGYQDGIEITNIRLVFGRMEVDYKIPFTCELITVQDLEIKLSILAETYRLIADCLAYCGNCGEPGEVVITEEGIIRILCNNCSH